MNPIKNSAAGSPYRTPMLGVPEQAHLDMPELARLRGRINVLVNQATGIHDNLAGFMDRVSGGVPAKTSDEAPRQTMGGAIGELDEALSGLERYIGEIFALTERLKSIA